MRKWIQKEQLAAQYLLVLQVQDVPASVFDLILRNDPSGGFESLDVAERLRGCDAVPPTRTAPHRAHLLGEAAFRRSDWTAERRMVNQEHPAVVH